METWKECPFCGSGRLYLAHVDAGWQIGCLYCHISGPTCRCEAGAVSAWNTRPGEADIHIRARAENNALAADLAVARKWSARWKAGFRDLLHWILEADSAYNRNGEPTTSLRGACGLTYMCHVGADCIGDSAELAALRAAMPPDAAGLLRAAGARPLKRTERAAARAWAARLDALAGEGEG